MIAPVKSPAFSTPAARMDRRHKIQSNGGPGVTGCPSSVLAHARREAFDVCARLDLSSIMYLGNNDAIPSGTKLAARFALGDNGALTRQLAFFAAHLPDPPQHLAICDVFSHPLVKPMHISAGHRLRAVLGILVLTQDELNLGSLFLMDHNERRWTEEDASEVRFLAGLLGEFLPVPKTISVKVPLLEP